MAKPKTFNKFICVSCNKESFHRGNGAYKYCSDECMRKAKEPQKRETPLHDSECQLCSKIFQVKNRLTAKYCSDKCRSLARYRKMTGRLIKAPREKGEYGKGYTAKNGYRVIYRDHPNANKKTRIILEHIFVMSQMIGRPLRKGETVHHKNAIRHDNRPENLELWSSRHPAGINVEERIKSDIEFLKEQGYEVIKL